jgi:hypothetical protein
MIMIYEMIGAQCCDLSRIDDLGRAGEGFMSSATTARAL